MAKDYMSDFWSGFNNTVQAIDNLKNEPIKRSANQLLLEDAQVKLEDDLKIRNAKVRANLERLMNDASQQNMAHTLREDYMNEHRDAYQTGLNAETTKNLLNITQNNQTNDLLKATEDLTEENKKAELKASTAGHRLNQQSAVFNYEDGANTRPATQATAVQNAQTNLINAQAGGLQAQTERDKANMLFHHNRETLGQQANNLKKGQQVQNIDSQTAVINAGNNQELAQATQHKNELSKAIAGKSASEQLNFLKQTAQNATLSPELRIQAQTMAMEVEKHQQTYEETEKAKAEKQQKELIKSQIMRDPFSVLAKHNIQLVQDKNGNIVSTGEGENKRYKMTFLIPQLDANGQTIGIPVEQDMSLLEARVLAGQSEGVSLDFYEDLLKSQIKNQNNQSINPLLAGMGNKQ